MTAMPLPDVTITEMADVLRILAHESRLRLIDALFVGGERSVGELEGLTGIGQPALSQQLGILRKADLVNTRRAAKQVYYSIRPEAFARLADYLARLATGGQEVASAPRPVTAPGAAAMFARIL